ncbi:hypothetical protein V565_102170, partial [Rhizoctonia solani 123E]
MNGPFSSFGPPQGTPIWYKNSLTNALRTIAQKSKAVLPQDIYAIIEEAAGRVYVYESYIHDMHAVNPDRPIHSDPLGEFVPKSSPLSLRFTHHYSLILSIFNMFMCPAPPATLNMFWYQGSLSCALQKIAHNTKGRLAPEISASLTEAAGRVFIQESYVNDLLVANAGCSISPDPLFVYGGYMNALSNLLGVLTLPGFEGTSRGRACRSM